MKKTKKNKVTKKMVQSIGDNLMKDFKNGSVTGSFYQRLQNILLGFDNVTFKEDFNCMISLRGGKAVFLIYDFKFWK